MDTSLLAFLISLIVISFFSLIALCCAMIWSIYVEAQIWETLGESVKETIDSATEEGEERSMDTQELRVHVQADGDDIIITTLDDTHDKTFVPAGGTRFGCVLIGTKDTLGISEEAWELLQKGRTGRDAIGDISMFRCNDGEDCFAWIGPPNRVTDSTDFTFCRDGFFKDLRHVKIPNDLPQEYLDFKAEEEAEAEDKAKGEIEH